MILLALIVNTLFFAVGFAAAFESKERGRLTLTGPQEEMSEAVASIACTILLSVNILALGEYCLRIAS